VMPGRQTHPHLYDRLLSAGIQPDFPRPAPPPQGKQTLTAMAATIVSFMLMLFVLIAVGVTLKLTMGWEPGPLVDPAGVANGPPSGS